MDINVIDSSGSNEWDYELKSLNASIFLTYTWLNALNSEQTKPLYLKFLAVNEIVGFIAGLIRPIRNSTHKQLFFYSGPICTKKNPALFDECRKALLVYAKANGFQRVTMHSYDISFYLKTRIKKFITRERAEYFFDLSPDFQEFERLINRDTRRSIRKAKKNGAVFDSGYSYELLDRLLLLMKSTFDIRLSKDYNRYPIFSMQFLDRHAMRKLLDSRIATLYYVKFGEDIVSMQFVVAINQRTYGIYMGTNALGYKLAAPSLLFYQIAHDCKQKGFHNYNIGGVPLGKKNEGVRNFKKNLGAKTVQSCEETTDYLISPLNNINFLLVIKRFLLNVRLPWIVKKQLLRGIDFYIMGRDQY